MADKAQFSLQGQNGAVGPTVYLGTEAQPTEYFVIGAYNNLNHIDTKSRPLEIVSSTSPINLSIKNLPKASTAPAGTEFASIVINKATGQLYMLG